MMCCEYDNHGVLQNSYRFQKYDCLFHQAFYFACCDFVLWVVSDDNTAMSETKNA